MAKSVELSNGRAWGSQTAAKRHFKEMLGRYKNGQVISDLSDHSDLASLLERFDELVADGPSKIGPGIDRFERRLNRSDGWSSPGFWVIRVDRSATDFSYVTAVDGSSKSEAQEFYDACHNAVSRDLISLKQKQFDHFSNADGELDCDITGEPISFADAKLSHAEPSFRSIVGAFRDHKGWREALPAGLLTASSDAQLSSHFSDDAIAREFRVFHHSIAVLHIVSKAPHGGPRPSVPKRPLRLL